MCLNVQIQNCGNPKLVVVFRLSRTTTARIVKGLRWVTFACIKPKRHKFRKGKNVDRFVMQIKWNCGKKKCSIEIHQQILNINSRERKPFATAADERWINKNPKTLHLKMKRVKRLSKRAPVISDFDFLLFETLNNRLISVGKNLTYKI